jgi:hypothetical protein
MLALLYQILDGPQVYVTGLPKKLKMLDDLAKCFRGTPGLSQVSIAPACWLAVGALHAGARLEAEVLKFRLFGLNRAIYLVSVKPAEYLFPRY